MVLQQYKAVSAVLIFIVSAVLPLVLLKRRERNRHGETMTLGEAFATGIFLGAAFFHLLPDATELFEQHYASIHYPVPQAVCIGSVLLFLVLERWSLAIRDWSKARLMPFLVLGILVIHAITEGAALGIGAELTETIMLSIAIIAHKGSESFALAMVLLRGGWSITHVRPLIWFFAAMTPFGILLGAGLRMATATSGPLFTSLFSAFAAGTFIYIATLHQLHGHAHSHDSGKSLVYLVAGAVLMGVLAIWT